MKTLITGASGFIGQHLTDELRGKGHDVVGLDIQPPAREHVAHVTADLRHPGAFEAALREWRPDLVIHLAAQVGRLFGEDDVRASVRSNAEMTTAVARACGDHDVALVYASTSEVYGDNHDVMCDEIDGPFSLPHNIYGLSKRWGEEACNLYAPDGLKVLRFSMPYGPGVVPGRGRAALPNMLWQAATGQRIPVHRGSRRSWCWIGDTVRAARLVIEQAAPGAYNVGRDDAEVTMGECAQMACGLVGASADVIDIVPAPPKQTVVKRLATERVRALGWVPEVELREGMVRILHWVRQFDAEGRIAA